MTGSTVLEEYKYQFPISRFLTKAQVALALTRVYTPASDDRSLLMLMLCDPNK